MANKKRRAVQSIMEEESYTITREKLPKEWVIHTYTPDYGIDFIVEIFDFIDNDKLIAETLGELFFAQLKSTKKIKIVKKKVFSRMNVEKMDETDLNLSSEIEVIAFPIDVSELLTVQAMSSTIPVLLFLANLHDKELYFLCLNDYIEKILLHENPDYSKQDKITIHIPLGNRVTNDEKIICQLMFYARRAKFFGAFVKFFYQRHELDYNRSFERVRHFISIIKKYDFWRARVKWPPIVGMIDELELIEELINATDAISRKNIYIKYNKEKHNNYLTGDEEVMAHLIVPLWDRLCNLSRIYEELCKEWFLPTYLWNELY